MANRDTVIQIFLSFDHLQALDLHRGLAYEETAAGREGILHRLLLLPLQDQEDSHQDRRVLLEEQHNFQTFIFGTEKDRGLQGMILSHHIERW